MTRSVAYERYTRAAINLAIGVEVTARIAEDPDYPADRTPRADTLRSAQRVEDIERFRTALAEYEASLSDSGDSEWD